MPTPKELYHQKNGETLVKNLQKRHFEAYYCANREDALAKALSLIPEGSSVGWGGAASAAEIGLLDAVRTGPYKALDRDTAPDAASRNAIMEQCRSADVFLTGANALSMDGQMVNIDGMGNRISSIIYGPKAVIVIAGINKLCPDLDSAMVRARTVAAPTNQQRFQGHTPCTATGACADCTSEDCICNQILVTRHCRPAGRIKFIIVGESLGF